MCCVSCNSTAAPRCNAVKLQVDEEYADSYDLPGRTSKTSVGGGLQYHITSRHFREEAKHWQELGDQTEHNSRVTNSTGKQLAWASGCC